MEKKMNYYDSQDLKKFPQISDLSPDMASKFFEWYSLVTSTDTALTKREKSLIALAVSHTLKCPYCIDAYTTTCLENGADPQQMMEAVQVSAAMAAGVTLVHGVQMQNHLREKGVID
jgi:alkylhydroperoxidase/carboxymuconolactone decarboxylase family protein